MYHELLLQAGQLIKSSFSVMKFTDLSKITWELITMPILGTLAAVFRKKIWKWLISLKNYFVELFTIVKKNKMNTAELQIVKTDLQAAILSIQENTKTTNLIYQQMTAVNGGSLSERVNTLVTSVGEIKNQQDNMSERVARLIAYSKTNEAILPFGSFYMMPDGKWVECNKKLSEWTGRERAEFFDKDWINAIYIEDREWFFKLVIEVMNNQYELDRPVRMQDKDGQPFTVRFQAKAVINGSKLLGYRGTIEKVNVNLPTEK